PERLGLDRRWPWIKWLVITPIAAFALLATVDNVADADNYGMTSALRWLDHPLGDVAFVLGMVSISGYFSFLGSKLGASKSHDAKRRLRLLMTGSCIAMTPLFIVALYGLFKGFESVPERLWIPAILLIAVFPLTLAYVIVVQRALDLRVVIRQGLQYAL